MLHEQAVRAESPAPVLKAYLSLPAESDSIRQGRGKFGGDPKTLSPDRSTGARRVCRADSPHGLRKASDGSSPAAFRPGPTQAAVATASITSGATTNETASSGPTPKRMGVSTELVRAATPTANAIPVPAGTIPVRRT